MEKNIVLDKIQCLTKSNRLVESRDSLTILEQRMMITICSQLKKNANEFEVARVSIDDMAKFCNIGETGKKDEVKRVLDSLLTKTIRVKKPDGNWYMTHWIQSAELLDGDIIEYRIDQKLKPDFLQLKSAYFSTSGYFLLDSKKPD
ncbi:replication initiation protein [Selenomonas ruminantium]|nr:replication initiation protein [Selenomonas ruminantium]